MRTVVVVPSPVMSSYEKEKENEDENVRI